MPHRVFLLPYPNFQSSRGVRLARTPWERGCYRGLGMVQLVTFCRPLHLVAVALCSATIAVSVTPASARSHHGAGRHARAYHAGHHVRWHHHHYRYYRHVVRDYGQIARDYRYVARDHRHAAHVSRWKGGVGHARTRGVARSYASYSASRRAANSAGVMSHSDSANSVGVTTGGS